MNLLLALVGRWVNFRTFSWRSDAGAKPGLLDWQRSDKSELGDEIADIFLYLIRLSDVWGIDLPRQQVKNWKKIVPNTQLSGVTGALQSILLMNTFVSTLVHTLKYFTRLIELLQYVCHPMSGHQSFRFF